jgi:phosphotransferase system HPr-like phosphotransfer protein
MGLMMLAVGPGSRIAVHVEEPNARLLLDELQLLIAKEFNGLAG